MITLPPRKGGLYTVTTYSSRARRPPSALTYPLGMANQPSTGSAV